MNNQFSQKVSDIIVYSKEEANRLKSSYIGPEHLLLGMPVSYTHLTLPTTERV